MAYSLCCVQFAALALVVAFHAAASEPRPAFQARLADRALVLDIVRAGDRLVAVGERGHVLYSDDGRDWVQAEVPVQATLTRVAYSDGELWAVGHDTTIIHSDDLGQTWTLQHFEPEWEQPLLDLHFSASGTGLAIGAYGLILRTTDGKSWTADNMADLVVAEAIDWGEAAEAAEEFEGDLVDDDWDDGYYDAELDFDRGCYEFMECHLNAVVELDRDRLLIAAEQGYGFRSTDGGETWESFRFAYIGSMFGLLAHEGCMTAYGLRGHVQTSCDFGDTWTLLDTGTRSSLMGGTRRADGSIILVGANGDMIEIAPDGTLSRRSHPRGSDLAMAIEGPQGLIVVGEDGIQAD